MQTDITTNVTIISYFSYSMTKVTTTTTATTTTIIFLGPRCFATRGQKEGLQQRDISSTNLMMTTSLRMLFF